MPKVSAPFLSQSASGSVGDALTARRTASGAVISKKRVRGTPFPQGTSESIPRRNWWTRGNAFKVAAAFRPILESLDGNWFLWDDERTDESMRGIIDFLALTGDGNLGLRPSKSRLSFYSQSSVINLISLEVDRYAANAAEVDAIVEASYLIPPPFPRDFFSRWNSVNAYEDPFVSRRNISKAGVIYLWSRILLDWFAVRLPGGFWTQSAIFPEPIGVKDFFLPNNFAGQEKQRDGSRLAPPRCRLSGEEQLANMIALRARMRGEA